MKKLIAFVVVALFIVGMVSVSMLPSSQESEEAVFMATSTKIISTTPTTWFSCAAPALDNEWSYTPAFSTIGCNGVYYLGNYGAREYLISPTYNVGPHQGIIISLKLMLLDSWDGESFFVKANDIVVYSYQWNEKKGSSNTCGYRWTDVYPSVTFGFNHTASTVTFVLYSTLDQDKTDESWGVCDFTVTASLYPVTYEGKFAVDLAGTPITYFPCATPAKANNWYYQPRYSTIKCNGNNYLGSYFEKEYVSTPPFTVVDHKGIIVSLKIALVGSWSFERFQIKADNNIVYTGGWISFSRKLQNCDHGWQGQTSETVTFGFNHTANTLSFVFTSTVLKATSFDHQSWGICDLTITTSPYPVTSDGKPKIM